MKKIWLAIFTLLVSTSAFSYSIVFVHIGTPIPTFVEDALKQAKYFNPEADVYLICNQRALKRFFKRESGLQDIKIVTCESLGKSKVHKLFDERLGWEDGFWKRAIERFYYLDTLMHKEGLNDVFHLESDNLLYVNLQEMLPIFHKKYPGLGVTFDNENRGIGGFMYVSSAEKMRDFVSFISDNARLKLYDMFFLSLYKNRKGLDQVAPLPIIMNEYIADYGLQSDTGDTTDKPEYFSCNVDAFGSIFDAAALGQYIGGVDPIHKNSAPGFVNETCLFNPSRLNFVWRKDHNGKEVPFAIYGDKKWRINSLHIHCKNLKKFSTYE